MNLPSPSLRRAAVIGAGIGGLAAAISLRERGWQVDVFERAPQLRSGGGVLLLWPNGLRALETLGLAAPVRARGVSLRHLRVHGWSGRLALQVAAPQWRQILGEAPLYIERRALMDALVERGGRERLWLGREFVGLGEGGRGPIFVAGGQQLAPTHAYDLVVGADGIRSRVARALGNLEPQRHIATLWLGRVPAGPHSWLPPPGDVVIIHGRRFRVILGVLPRNDRRDAERLEWTIYDNQSGSREHPDPLEFDELRAALRSCAFPIGELLDRCDDPQRLAIAVQAPDRCWHREGVVLLGDAAHASSPELGQGACQSFESAVALAEALERGPTRARALEDYAASRRVRASVIASTAELTTTLAGLGGPIVDPIRDLLVEPGWGLFARHLMRTLASS